MKNKDVIYIDIDDDITAVIDKIKSAGQDIVALVPPKRSSVMQSVVNLKLLKRKAEAAGRSIVLVTSDHTTTTLAGSLGLYVAKNLQSKPEIPTVAAALETPVEEEAEAIAPPAETTPSAAAATAAKPSQVTDEDLKSINPEASNSGLKINDHTKGAAAAAGAAEAASSGKKAKKGFKKPKIPNFSGFRKKLLIIGGIIILLIIALVVFFTLKGKTTVTIHAQTSSTGLDFNLKVDANAAATDPKNDLIKATSQQLQKTQTQTFSATGQKNNGQKASGTIVVSNCQTPSSFDIPAGTTFTANNGMQFVSTADAQASGGSGNYITGCTHAGTSNPIPVQASQPGGSYNLSAQSYQTNLGSQVTAQGSQMSGGTDQIVQVITQQDVDGAVAKLKSEDTSSIQKELAGQFNKDLRILNDSFTASAGSPSVTPNVGDQASQGTVTIQYTYTMLAISNDDLNAVLDNSLSGQIQNSSTQRIYKNGFDTIKMSLNGTPSPSSASYHVITTGYIGPQFDEDSIKKQITGKKYGDIVSTIQQIPGVNSVDVHFSPFWSHSAGPPSRIVINLDVSKAAGDNL